MRLLSSGNKKNQPLYRRGLAICAAATLLAACGAGDDEGDQETADGDTEEIDENGAEDVDFPTENMTMIIAYEPGGTTDPMGRQFADQLSDILDANILVENVGGGAATIGTNQIVTSEADGHTIGLTENGAIAYQPLVTDDLTYGPTEGYTVLGKMGAVVYTLAVQDDAPWETFEELLEDAESRPGEITVSTPGPGNPGDLVLAQLNSQIGNVFDGIPYDGGGDALTALLGGEVDVNVGATATIQAQVEAGELRALTSFTEEAYFATPDVPPITEFGYDATIGADFYIIAPAGLPDDVLGVLSDATEEVVFSDEFQEWMQGAGAEPQPMTSEEATSDLEQYAEIFAELQAQEN